MTDTITAWQCIGCGRLEAPQNCVGICQDRKVELVSAWDHAEALVALDDARATIASMTALLERLAHTRPRNGQWEASWRALQAEARAVLGSTSREIAAPGTVPT